MVRSYAPTLSTKLLLNGTHYCTAQIVGCRTNFLPEILSEARWVQQYKDFVLQGTMQYNKVSFLSLRSVGRGSQYHTRLSVRAFCTATVITYNQSCTGILKVLCVDT
eukprot:509882-Rhodomonas_salina.2